MHRVVRTPRLGDPSIGYLDPDFLIIFVLVHTPLVKWALASCLVVGDHGRTRLPRGTSRCKSQNGDDVSAALPLRSVSAALPLRSASAALPLRFVSAAPPLHLHLHLHLCLSGSAASLCFSG